MVHHLQGRFIELQFRKITNYQEENLCKTNFGWFEEEKDDEAEEDEVTEYGELEERVYTIHDGNLEYEVIKRYKIVGITDQTA